MSATVLDGKGLAAQLEVGLRARVAHIRAACGSVPVLATIRVGDDPAPRRHLRLKGNACHRVGVEWRPIELAAETTTADLLTVIDRLNRDDDVSGVLLQMPLPGHIDSRACCDAIAEAKDVDGLGSYGFARRAMGSGAFGRATPLAVMRLLSHYRIPVASRHAVVVGGDAMLGKPMAMMLLQANATVSLVAPDHAALKTLVGRADLIFAGVGKPEFVKEAWIRDGAVVIDAGYNAGNIGDVELRPLRNRIAAYTPVPGGVYPMTINTLMMQLVEAMERHLS